MGYTNYWYQYRDFTDSEWDEIVDYFNTLMEKEEYRKLMDQTRFQKTSMKIKKYTLMVARVDLVKLLSLNKHEPKPRYERDKPISTSAKLIGYLMTKLVWKLLKFIN